MSDCTGGQRFHQRSAITMRTTFAGPKIFGRPIILPTRYPLWARLPLVVGVPALP
jgi:hypothetical protein